jgi:hypothetical protein
MNFKRVLESAAKVSAQAGQVYGFWAGGNVELTRTAAEVLIDDCAALMNEAQRLRGEVHQIPSLELASTVHAAAVALTAATGKPPHALANDKGSPEKPGKPPKRIKGKA